MSNDTSNMRYVAFFDMLGFKEAVKRNSDEAWGALEDLRVSMEETLNLFVKLPNEIILTPINANDRTIAINFSDSVLIFTQGNATSDLHRMLIVSAGFFAKALHRCVPLRGGISYGSFKFNPEKNLYCGPPLVEAYEIGQSAQWSGIVVDEVVAQQYQKNPLKSNGKLVLMMWDVPVKEKGETRKTCWVLNWPLVHRNNFTTNSIISPELYGKAFESLFGNYNDWSSDVRTKYENTVEFINVILEQKGY